MISIRLTLLAGISACVFAQSPEYNGPAILGTGESSSNSRETIQTGFRPYILFNQVYDSGLLINPTSPNATQDVAAGYGAEAEVGLTGYHHWQRTLLELNYRGDFRRYSQDTIYNGTDQYLDLRIKQRVTRRLTVSVKEKAGTFANNFGGGLGFASPNLQSTPSQELASNRVNYFDTEGVASYQLSRRLAVVGSASGFLVERQSATLFGESGYLARGDVIYRLTRRTTIGAEYDFNHIALSNYLGTADVQTVAVNYAIRLSRTWEIATRIGTSRAETQGVTAVNIDPAVAAIIGRSSGFETVYEVRRVPVLSGRVVKNMGRATIQVEYVRGITPGNGLGVASQTTGFNARYAFSGIGRWNFEATVGSTRMEYLVQSTTNYQGYSGGVSISRQVERNCRVVARFDVRQYDVTLLTTPDRTFYRATIGVAFSPGDRRLEFR
jgi:hypothetical protein